MSCLVAVRYEGAVAMIMMMIAMMMMMRKVVLAALREGCLKVERDCTVMKAARMAKAGI